jgi:hypothetical protein
MMVNDHHVVHAIHLFPPIEPRSINRIVPRFTNIDEDTNDKLHTTLELEHN